MTSDMNYYFWVSSVKDGLESGKSAVVTVRTAAVPVNPATDNFVRINGGTFTMGSPASEVERNEMEIQHQVTVSSFYMGKYEVTQREWAAVMGSNPSNFKGDNLPVEMVSWFDAIDYCNRRSQREGLTPAYTRNGENVTWNRGANGYRLPTEAEWEYACRAGTSGPFSTGNNITTNQANYNGNFPYNGNAKGQNRGKTWDAGSGAANAWGLYDMHGNVREWCWDRYGTYPSGAQTDPAGAASGSSRVLRGGSWNYYARYLRSAARGSDTPSIRLSYHGFRLVRP
jgi:formylglycine-generating enzyme required for sulfatase activity